MSSQVIGLTDLLDSAVSNQLWLYLGTAFVIIILVAQRWSQGTRCRCGASLIGKSVVITGASDGIGVPTAHAMARRGARVIMACRNVGKAERVATQIRRETGNGNVIVMKCDLASLSSVRQFCDNYMGCETRLDILINNAGIMACPYSKTVDGFEMQMGVNHFGHFLLTNLLTPLLVQSAPSRVVVLTSEAHRGGQINFEDINSEKQYSPFKGYFQSKLANVLFATELHNRLSGYPISHPNWYKEILNTSWTSYRRSKAANVLFAVHLQELLKDSGVSVYIVHPGLVKTNLPQGAALACWQQLILATLSMFLLSPIDGAQGSLHAASVSNIREVPKTYSYYCCMKKQQLDSEFTDSDSAKAFWEESMDSVGILDQYTCK